MLSEKKILQTKTLNKKEIIGFSLAIVTVLVGVFIPPFEGLTTEGIRALSMLFFAVVLWSTEVVSAPVTALSILVLIPLLNILPLQDTFIGLGATLIWRLMGILLITEAVQDTGLHKRLSFYILGYARGNIKVLYFLIVLMAYLFVFIIPTPIGRVALLSTISSGILYSMNIKPPHNLGKLFLISISIVSIIASSTVIVGASAMIYSAALFERMLGINISYLEWLKINFPITFLTAMVLFVAMPYLFPYDQKTISGNSSGYLTKMKQEMGPMGIREKKILVLYLLLVSMWISGLADRWPAELGIAYALFLPGIKIVSWGEISKKISWGTLILFGSSLSLAEGLQRTGAINWIVESLSAKLGNYSPLFIALCVILLTLLIRLGMSNMTGAIATILPLIIVLAQDLGLNPLWLGMTCVISSSLAFFLPTQSPSHLATYSLGFYTISDFLKAGTVTAFIFITFILLGINFYWPLIGIPVF